MDAANYAYHSGQSQDIPDEFVKEMEEEAISREQVVQLLSEMEMINENGETIWEEGSEGEGMELDEKMKDILEILPMDILPSSQEFGEMGNEENLQGFAIPEAKESQKREGEGAEECNQEQEKEGHGEKKRGKWGPVIAERRSSRIINDGRSSLEKAKDNKKKEDLEDNYNQAGLVRCQIGLEENPEAVYGVEDYLQGGKDGGDEEMVVFFGETSLGAIADSRRFKLSMKNMSPEMMKSRMEV